MMLPIGSIVYLEDSSQKVMLLNVGPVVEQNGVEVYFDYSGAIYPAGLDPEQVYYFNQEDIAEVVFEGYQDEDSERFNELYEQWVEDNQDEIPRGEVE
ncbi:DUF4176 domain-containing protein [Bombilactobacillus thymidiniphilus]|uniref:DUF4176 domain-containing protein n=1 Tax=Bombilactobacillus thymidiniphilus TaxID=2923363 RepID=A0ABY4PEW4_9LACO|nr:DUF4176 domain-containing protein [Bombilactobacillus thymidiniphilus]UQS84348.1 DUF4176 domain-containing protein [Bombilactobacillus thymidiniphilus]